MLDFCVWKKHNSYRKFRKRSIHYKSIMSSESSTGTNLLSWFSDERGDGLVSCKLDWKTDIVILHLLFLPNSRPVIGGTLSNYCGGVGHQQRSESVCDCGKWRATYSGYVPAIPDIFSWRHEKFFGIVQPAAALGGTSRSHTMNIVSVRLAESSGRKNVPRTFLRISYRRLNWENSDWDCMKCTTCERLLLAKPILL